jgi:aminoglycoside phosphotransferase family enzyme
MRRMPDDRRLSALVGSGAPVQEHLRALARSVAAFHASARRGPEITREGGRDALGARWAANVAEVRTSGTVLAADLVDAVDRLSSRFLAGREPLLADRCARGRIVDGHGDLMADDVFCLDDGPRALDCLEFDDRLRYLDGLDDVALLAMDLERPRAPRPRRRVARRLRRVLR